MPRQDSFVQNESEAFLPPPQITSFHLKEEASQENFYNPNVQVKTDEPPILRLVHDIICEAHQLGASDIHIEPLGERLRLRYRIDGILQEMRDLPKRLQPTLISQIKIMANIDIAEKRLPQDGRFMLDDDRKFSFDLRVSTIPAMHGESIAMRILDRQSLILGLSELGLWDDDRALIEKTLGYADGMFLVTGPTGSGKTTTLYTCLHLLNKPQRKIITVEDPVEYRLEGINQAQVNPLAKMTFASALRAMLRQSPDTIMVGEIRDAETAHIAINAALTGHLVLSTLHTNDAAGAITRLTDIGIKPFLVSSALKTVAAQRLVRKICSKCAQPYIPSTAERDALNLDPSTSPQHGIGCSHCRKTGYRGRTGIFEILILNDYLRTLINQKADLSEIRQYARSLGMRTLREDALRKASDGLTTLREILASTMNNQEEFF